MKYDDIAAVLTYNPDTGRFYRNGKEITHRTAEKYRKISVNGKQYYAHRLAFLLMTGKWPKECVDHINNDGSDNRWCNLREARHVDNVRNVPVKRKRNSHLPKGVWYDNRRGALKNRYCACITFRRKLLKLGRFATAEEAKAAYDRKAAELFGEFACE